MQGRRAFVCLVLHHYPCRELYLYRQFTFFMHDAKAQTGNLVRVCVVCLGLVIVGAPIYYFPLLGIKHGQDCLPVCSRPCPRNCVQWPGFCMLFTRDLRQAAAWVMFKRNVCGKFTSLFFNPSIRNPICVYAEVPERKEQDLHCLYTTDHRGSRSPCS
jgi:hypothetical protein